MPKTKMGKWSVWLAVCFFVLVFVFFCLVKFGGERGGETYFSNFKLAIPFTAGWLCAIASFFVGVVSVWKYKERAVLVFLSILIGLFVLWWVLAEAMFPH